MKNYLNFETEMKRLEAEIDQLKDPFNQEGLSEIDMDKISKLQNEIDIKLKEINAPNSYIIEGSGNSPVGFASGKAKVKLEDSEGGTKLNYEVEANVGGKIAQVGSRLIDMTANKMADVFFRKFSELISLQDVLSENEKNEKPKTLNKINSKKLFYISILLLLMITGYFII